MQQLSPATGPDKPRLIPVGEKDNGAEAPVAAKPGLLTRLRLSPTFALIVVLPVVLAGVYFGMLAADRYETEAKFVVRSPGAAMAGQLASLVQGSSVIRSSDDAYIVHAYIASRDAMRTLIKEIKLLDILARSQTDLLWRYPGLLRAHNEERLHKHLQSMIHVHFDSTTGISTLKVQAFEPADAQVIAQALLRNSELLINRLSERGQADAVEAALRDVDTSRKTAVAAQQVVTDFRTRHSMVDPTKISTSAQETISRLALETAQTSAQLAELERASPQSPQIAAFRLRISALEGQIFKERKSLAGADGSLAPLIAEYERLMLEREFAERTFGSALTALEIARADAHRQRLFLEQISLPTPPDYARYPYRLLSLLLVLALGLATHSIVRRVLVEIRSHDGH